MATISLAINGRLAQCDQPRVIPTSGLLVVPLLTRPAIAPAERDSDSEQCAENVDSPDARLEPRAAS